MSFIEISEQVYHLKVKKILTVVSGISIFVLLLFPTQYLDTEYGSCTLGPKAFITYGILILYLIYKPKTLTLP